MKIFNIGLKVLKGGCYTKFYFFHCKKTKKKKTNKNIYSKQEKWAVNINIVEAIIKSLKLSHKFNRKTARSYEHFHFDMKLSPKEWREKMANSARFREGRQ